MMRTIKLLSIVSVLVCLATSLSAQVPGIINYQGRVAVNSTNFDGTGQFKFALVNGAGTATFWSNGVNAVSVSVTKGLYAILLGDTSIANMASSIPATVFTNHDVRLRVWFNGGSGLQQLAPDQRLAAAGYALIAAGMPDGAITSNKLAAGAVGTAQLAAGAVTAVKIPNGAIDSTKLAANAVTTTALADGAVSSAKIADGAIVNADISDAAGIDAGKIVGGDLQARRLRVGVNHVLTGNLATIAGGTNNTASGDSATVGGGWSNQASGGYATVGGGVVNTASSLSTTVGGGAGNVASDYWTTVGGGQRNTASYIAATVSGGWSNTASACGAFVGGGGYDGNIVIGGNVASGRTSAVAGGFKNTASGAYASVIGGYANIASGPGAVVAGGGWAPAPVQTGNTASGTNSVVSGGLQNAATMNLSTVGGGLDNTASGDHATVGGGQNNTATYSFATVGGGLSNQATNFCAVVSGGSDNVAGGQFSFAAGRRAEALHDGAFVWADSTAADFASTLADQFCVRANGGVFLQGNGGGAAPQLTLLQTANDYCRLRLGTSGYPSWDISSQASTTPDLLFWNGTANMMILDYNGNLTITGTYSPSSDRNAKENLRPVNPQAVLAKVAALPIAQWNFKQEAVRHIGPMAQDFQAAFNVGADDKHIATVDADGVALAAIQGLYQEMKDEDGRMKDEVNSLKRENRDLRRELAELRALIKETVGSGAMDRASMPPSAPMTRASTSNGLPN